MSKLLLLVFLVLPVSSYANEAESTIPYDQDMLADILNNYSPEAFAEGNGEPIYEDMQRRRRRRPIRRNPRRPRRYEPWYFLGCARTSFDCSWAATRYGFRESRAVWDIRCRSAAYACYARNRWN